MPAGASSHVLPTTTKPVYKLAGKPAPAAFANHPFAKLDLGARDGSESRSE